MSEKWVFGDMGYYKKQRNVGEVGGLVVVVQYVGCVVLLFVVETTYFSDNPLLRIIKQHNSLHNNTNYTSAAYLARPKRKSYRVNRSNKRPDGEYSQH